MFIGTGKNEFMLHSTPVTQVSHKSCLFVQLVTQRFSAVNKRDLACVTLEV